FFSSLGTGAPTYEDKFYSIALSLALLGGFYLIVRKPAASAVFHLTSTLNEEVMIFVAFSLCLAMSVIAAFFGLAPSIGAFLAGSIVSQLPNSRRIEKAIKPLLLMFAALFFLSLGMRIDPNIVASNFVFAVELTALFISVCFLSVLVMLYITGAKLQNAVFGASAMVVLGEFSLLIASIAPGKLGTLLLSVGSFGVMATSLVSSALLDRQQLLLSFGRRLVPSLLYKPIKKLSAYFTGLLRDFSPGGSFWQISRAFWVMTRRQLGIIALIAVLTMALRAAAVHSGLAAGEAGFSLRLAILAVGLLPIIYLSIGILKEFTIVLDALSRSIARHKRNAKDESIILRDLTAGSLLIIIAILLPDAVSTLSLPSFFNFADEVLLVFAFAFAWDLFRHAGRLRIRAE
ncbi:MAG: cation:proton antiporter, partial [Candidatus Micrarchaeota archaeon]|nr:cation:proton antiporter [Candidatus Micrarchaeota archaeon]